MIVQKGDLLRHLNLLLLQQINVKGEWQELTSETEYYELFLQKIELYTLLSWGNNGYVKSLINQKSEWHFQISTYELGPFAQVLYWSHCFFDCISSLF